VLSGRSAIESKGIAIVITEGPAWLKTAGRPISTAE
jgi:hypothetical protein